MSKTPQRGFTEKVWASKEAATLKLPRYEIRAFSPEGNETSTLKPNKRRAVALAKQRARNGFSLVQVWQRTYRFGGTEERLVAEYSGPPVRSLRTFSHLRFKPHAIGEGE